MGHRKDESSEQSRRRPPRKDPCEPEPTRPSGGFLGRASLPLAIILDSDLRVVSVAPEVLDFFGAGDLVALRLLWERDIRPIVLQGLSSGSTTDRAVLLSADEVTIPATCLFQMTPLATSAEDGRLIATLTRFRSLDELDELFEQASRLKNFARVYDALVHDLRVPLNSMTLAIELFERSISDEVAKGDAAEYAATLREELARFHELFCVFLQAARSTFSDEQTDSTDLASMVREVMAPIAPFADSRGIRLALSVPDSFLAFPRVEDGSDRLKHAITTFVLRVLHSLEPGGVLTVEAAEETGRDTVHVLVTAAAPRENQESRDSASEERPVTQDRSIECESELAIARAIVAEFGGAVRPVTDHSDRRGIAIEIPCVYR